MMGVADRPERQDARRGVGQTVNGNYGFGTSDVEPVPGRATRATRPRTCRPVRRAARRRDRRTCGPGDYIVAVDIPKNPVGGRRRCTRSTSEEDVNVFDGDTYLPQENFPPITPAAAGDTPPGAGHARRRRPSRRRSGAGIVSPCAGALHTVRVTDQAFLDGGGSPFEGQDRPLVRRQAGHRAQRPDDRAELQPVHRRCRSRRTSGA